MLIVIMLNVIVAECRGATRSYVRLKHIVPLPTSKASLVEPTQSLFYHVSFDFSTLADHFDATRLKLDRFSK
jgi:hypothetical protein